MPQAIFTGDQKITFDWVYFALTVPFVAIRLYVQFWFKPRRVLWREVFIVLGLLAYLTQVIGWTIWHKALNAYDAGWNFDEETPRARSLLKVQMIHMVLSSFAPSMAKLTLLFFYMDLTPRYHSKTWLSIVAAWVLCVGACLYSFLWCFVSCVPFRDAITPFREWCWIRDWYFFSSWSLHAVSELAVYGIPFVILRNLAKASALEQSDRRASYWMLSAGAVNAVCTLYLGAFNVMIKWGNSIPGFGYYDAVYSFMFTFWIGSSIQIVCLPQVRRLLLGISAGDLQREMQQRRTKALQRWRQGSGEIENSSEPSDIQLQKGPEVGVERVNSDDSV